MPGSRKVEVEVYLFVCMTSALEGVGGQRHTLATSSPRNRPCTHYTRGWLSLRVGLVGSKKLPPPEFEPQTTQPAVSHYADRNIPTTFERE